MAPSIDFLPRYLKVYGLFRGLVTFFKIEMLKFQKVKIPTIKYAIELRPDTTDLLVFREVFLFKSYDLEWNAPKVILDCGGNTGLTSIFFANKFPQSRIYSIEPSASNFEILLKNTEPYNNVTAIQSAIWNKNTSIRIQNPKGKHWAFTVEECSPEHPDSIQAITIEALLTTYGLEYIDVLKLDIEGSERELFAADFDNWIKRTRCILIELHDWLDPNCSKTVFKTISLYNFKTTVFNGMLQFINSDI